MLTFLGALQEKLGWPDRRMAQELGISRTYFSQVKKGKRLPGPKLMGKIASLPLTCSPAFTKNVNYDRPFFAVYNVGIKNGQNLEKHFASFLLARQVEGKSPATLAFYGQNLGRFLWWLKRHGTELSLEAVDVNVIRSFLAYVQTATHRWGIGSRYSEHQASMSTVDAYWRTLQSFFAWLVKEKVLEEKDNPIKRIPRPRVQQKVVRDIPLDLINQALLNFGQTTFLGAPSSSCCWTQGCGFPNARA